MQDQKQIIFKNIRPHIAGSLKESCSTTDARLYNIANEVHNIDTFSIEPGVEIAKGLSKIIDVTVKNTLIVGCNLSVVVKGIMVGAFRSSQTLRLEAHKTIRLLIKETLQAVFKHKGNEQQMIEGILAAIVIISKEFKLNPHEALKIAQEDILFFANEIDPLFLENVKKSLPY